MKPKIKFVLHKSETGGGYIYLQSIFRRKKTYRSLGLPWIDETLWDKENQRVKKRKGIDHEYYNGEIEKKLKEVLTQNNDLSLIEGKHSQKSFITFFEEFLKSESIKSHGTRIKYNSILEKLKSYLEEYDLVELYYSDITTHFLEKFRGFMRTKNMETNTITHYLKILRIVIKKSVKKGEYYFPVDPYYNFTFDPIQKKIIEVLTEEEIVQIINTPVKDDEYKKLKDLFLFQFFTNGLRRSDLVTLRYKDLSNGMIKYTMYKTKNQLDIPITDNHIGILSRFMGIDTVNIYKTNTISGTQNSNWKEEVKNIFNQRQINQNEQSKTEVQSKRPVRPSPIRKDLGDVFLIYLPILVKVSPQSYNFYSPYRSILEMLNLEELIEEKNSLILFKNNKGKIIFGKMERTFSKEYEDVKDVLDTYISSISTYISILSKKCKDTILDTIHEKSVNNKTKNKFVFGLLDEEMFEGKNDFESLTPDQYDHIHKKGSNYGNKLKRLQKLLGIKKNFKTHLPRVSFTNIVLNLDGVNLNDVSKMLGHSSVSITNEYIENRFPKSNKVHDKIGSKFNFK